jgi:hypothetical protein
MAHSGGRWLVGVIGLGVLAAGLVGRPDRAAVLTAWPS